MPNDEREQDRYVPLELMEFNLLADAG